MSDTTMHDATGTEGEPAASTAVSAPPTPPVPAPPAPPAAPEGMLPGRGGGRGWRAGGVLFGGLLVVVGILALVGGFTSVVDVLRLWPLFIVFGGLAQILNPHGEAMIKRVAEGLGSVAIGLVLLGNTFGYIRWTVWFGLVSLWPLLVIALGIELVGRGFHMNWLRALSNVVLILGLAYGVFVLQYAPGHLVFPFFAASGPTTAFSEARPHDAAAVTGRAAVKVGATRLAVTGGGDLAGISGKAVSGATPKLAASVSSGIAEVTVEEPGNRSFVFGIGDGNVDVTLDRAVKWTEVRLDLGAVSASADLSGLQVEKVLMNVGASDVRLTIGSLASNVGVNVSGGATSVTIRVPANAACTVHATSGLSDVRVPPTFQKTSGIVIIGESNFVSTGSGGPTIAITLTSGVSDLRIETY